MFGDGSDVLRAFTAPQVEIASTVLRRPNTDDGGTRSNTLEFAFPCVLLPGSCVECTRAVATCNGWQHYHVSDYNLSCVCKLGIPQTLTVAQHTTGDVSL